MINYNLKILDVGEFLHKCHFSQRKFPLRFVETVSLILIEISVFHNRLKAMIFILPNVFVVQYFILELALVDIFLPIARAFFRTDSELKQAPNFKDSMKMIVSYEA